MVVNKTHTDLKTYILEKKDTYKWENVETTHIYWLYQWKKGLLVGISLYRINKIFIAFNKGMFQKGNIR